MVTLTAVLIDEDTVLTVLVLLQAWFKEWLPLLHFSLLKCCQTREADHGLGRLQLWIG